MYVYYFNRRGDADCLGLTWTLGLLDALPYFLGREWRYAGRRLVHYDELF